MLTAKWHNMYLLQTCCKRKKNYSPNNKYNRHITVFRKFKQSNLYTCNVSFFSIINSFFFFTNGFLLKWNLKNVYIHPYLESI